MNNLYNKIYEAVNNGIQKALILSDDQSGDSSVKFHNKEISNEFMPCELQTVDLGLPSGLLWCEYNLGAFPGNTPEDWYGNYYAWGELETRTDYTWETYSYCNNKYEFIKYNTMSAMGKFVDNKTILRLEDDIINRTLERQFRMPTKEECQELLDNTTHQWVKNYKGVYDLHGMLFTAKNGNTLFIPSSGYYHEQIHYGIEDNVGCIWSSSLYNDNSNEAFSFYFDIDEICIITIARFWGLPVRGVFEIVKNE